MVGLTVVSPGHLEKLQVPLLEGRGLTEADDTGNPDVVVVNHAMSERYWPRWADTSGCGAGSSG